MKRKIFLILAAAATVMSLACGCGNSSNTANNGDSGSKTEDKSSKRKYDNINADSTPVGVDELGFKAEKDYSGTEWTYLEGRIYKNSSDIEESLISVTFELYDENDEYICKKSVTTESLTEGEDERFSEDIIWEADDKYKKNVPNETLAKYTARVVDIEEVDAAEAAETAELEQTTSEIQSAIWNDEYNKAQVLLEAALQKYPDNTDLKLLQAELEEALAAEEN